MICLISIPVAFSFDPNRSGAAWQTPSLLGRGVISDIGPEGSSATAINNQEPGWENTLTGVPKEIYQLWQRHFRPKGYKLRFQIVEKDSGAFIGWFHLRPALDYRFAAEAGFREGDFDLGYRLCRAAWGQGYATVGACALVRKGFTELGVESVVAVALVGNRL